MVTNKVNMDLKVGSSSQTRQKEGDGGFSDVLGSVGSENRRQQGLSGSSESRDRGKEFTFTRKASERVYDKSGNKAEVRPSSEPSYETGGQGFDAETADRILSQAAETVVRAVSESGETPSKDETVEMMADAVRELAPEQNEQSADTGNAAAAETGKLVEVIADVIAAMTGGSEQPAADTVQPDEVQNEEPQVRVVTPDSSFIMTEKQSEAAMITEHYSMQEMPEMTENSGFMAELGELLRSGEVSPEEQEFLLKFTAGARDMLSGRNEFVSEDYTDRSGLIEKMLAKIDAENIEEGFEPVSGMEAVQDVAKMLTEIIDTAKKELGLTEVRYEQTTGEQDAAAPLIENNSAKLSRSMNSSDRTDELDHILGEERSGASPEEQRESRTETYDAVHMSERLIQNRADTDIRAQAPAPEEQNAGIRPPEVQTAEQILERIRSMQDDRMEFTMVLNPESLGRITVKLVMAGERTAVEISAENPETRAILAARSENLQTMLRDNGVELERYQVVSGQEDARFEQQNYDGSSKNPYSRSDSEEKKDDDDDEKGENFYDLLGQL